MGSKLFSCLFLPKVLCSFRKTEKSKIRGRCLKCRYYKEFKIRILRELLAESEELDE